MSSQTPASVYAETLALHAGWRADPQTGSVAVPIHQTTSYQFRDTDHAESLFALHPDRPEGASDAPRYALDAQAGSTKTIRFAA